MSSKIKHELCVVTGHYVDREGKEKNQWQKVGVELETESGGRIILLNRWFNPAGLPDPENRGTVMLSLFDPKTPGSSGQGNAPQKPAGSGLTAADFTPEGEAARDPDKTTPEGDDIPF